MNVRLARFEHCRTRAHFGLMFALGVVNLDIILILRKNCVSPSRVRRPHYSLGPVFCFREIRSRISAGTIPFPSLFARPLVLGGDCESNFALRTTPDGRMARSLNSENGWSAFRGR